MITMSLKDGNAENRAKNRRIKGAHHAACGMAASFYPSVFFFMVILLFPRATSQMPRDAWHL